MEASDRLASNTAQNLRMKRNPKVRLMGNLVLLQPLAPKLVSEAGIHFPPHRKWRDDESRWRVIAAGPGRTVRRKGKPDLLIPVEVERGDYVITMQIHGNRMALPNGNIIIDADELIAKWRLE